MTTLPFAPDVHALGATFDNPDGPKAASSTHGDYPLVIQLQRRSIRLSLRAAERYMFDDACYLIQRDMPKLRRYRANLNIGLTRTICTHEQKCSFPTRPLAQPRSQPGGSCTGCNGVLLSHPVWGNETDT